MNLSFHALAWLCVAQALFVICTSRQSVPRYGAAPQGAAPRRAPFRSLVHPTPKRRFIMTTINLKDFYYWYLVDELVEVPDEVAQALLAGKRAEAAHTERARYNKAY